METEDANKRNTESQQNPTSPKSADTTGTSVRGTEVTVDGEQARGREAAEPGLPLPTAGEHDIGAVGASGQTDTNDSGKRTGDTGDTRKNSGVSGQDLSADGLPPA